MGVGPEIKKTSFVVLLSISVFLLEIALNTAASSEADDILNTALARYGIKFEKGGSFPVVRDFIHPFKEKIFRTIIARGKRIRIKVEIIKPLLKKEALDFSKTKYTIIKSLYEPQIIPYSGKLTHTTDCPDKNKLELPRAERKH